jgi:uncharacterized protein YjbJ (UPF0337 family)
MVDKENIKGRVKQAEGAVKDAAGKITGNKDWQAEGKADKAEGKVRDAVGNLKDAARKVTGN